MTEYAHFDAAEYLGSEEAIEAFFEDANESNDANVIALALGAIARARSMTGLARDTGISRTGLYKALSPGGNPSLETIMKIADALDLKVTVSPKPNAAPLAKPRMRAAKSRRAAEPAAKPTSTPPAPPTRRRRAAATV